MNLVIFGLTISSSWGNGHATLWRGLCRALATQGHRVTFYERDVPYYAAHRDLRELPGGELVLYDSWADVAPRVRRSIQAADVAVVTSYCPHAATASRCALESPSVLRVFYDLDAPVTLAALDRGEAVPYLPPGGLADFDLVLSFTGGRTLDALRRRLGARRVAPLYGSVDPALHAPSWPSSIRTADLSYLGTYARDRQAAFDELFRAPARALPERRFELAGAQYPDGIEWPPNVARWPHLAPSEHAAFYARSACTLNITRAAMVAMGHCPSGRIFEAAACGVPIVSDPWEGMGRFLSPGLEIYVARSAQEVVEILRLPEGERARVAARAKERTLDEHTAEHRARELVEILSTREEA